MPESSLTTCRIRRPRQDLRSTRIARDDPVVAVDGVDIVGQRRKDATHQASMVGEGSRRFLVTTVLVAATLDAAPR